MADSSAVELSQAAPQKGTAKRERDASEAPRTQPATYLVACHPSSNVSVASLTWQSKPSDGDGIRGCALARSTIYTLTYSFRNRACLPCGVYLITTLKVDHSHTIWSIAQADSAQVSRH